MKNRVTTLRSAKVSPRIGNEATEAEGEMLTVHDYERIRRAYYIEKKSIRQIGRELRHSYWTVRKALDASEPTPYQLRKPRIAPMLGPYKGQIEQLLAENQQLPRKQRYTSKQIYQMMSISKPTLYKYIDAHRTNTQ